MIKYTARAYQADPREGPRWPGCAVPGLHMRQLDWRIGSYEIVA
jgi:hypothetical protein